MKNAGVVLMRMRGAIGFKCMVLAALSLGVLGCGSASSSDGSNGVDADNSGADAGSKTLAGISWTSMKGPAGGQILAFAQDPSDKRTLYAATWRGLYQSTDRGESWHTVGGATLNGTRSLGITANGVYACVASMDGIPDLEGKATLYRFLPKTGALEKIRDDCSRVHVSGNRLFVSVNPEQSTESQLQLLMATDTAMALSWKTISPSATIISELIASYEALGSGLPHGLRMTNVLVAGSRIVVNLVVHNDQRVVAFRVLVSDDEGQTYAPVDIGASQGFAVFKLAQDPADAKHLVAVLGAGDGSSFSPNPNELHESFDAGTSWSAIKLPFTEARVLDMAFSGTSYLLAGMARILRLHGTDHSQAEEISLPDDLILALDRLVPDAEQPNVIYGINNEGVFRSDDALKTWKKCSQGIVASPVANVTIHPTDPNVIVTSGNNAFFAQVTRDGGKTWEPSRGSSTMTDEVVFDPHHPSELLLIDEMSVIKRSADLGKSWTRIATRFSGARIVALAASETKGTLLAAVMGTGISRLTGLDPLLPKSDGWDHLYGSSDYAYSIVLDPQDHDVLYASYSPKIFEKSAGIWRYTKTQTEDNGWTQLLKVDDAAGITSIAVDPQSPQNLYAGVVGTKGRIVASSDRGKSWTTLNSDFTFATIHEIAVDPADEKTVYAAPWGGGLFRSTDGGQSFSEITTPTPSIVSVIADPADSKHLYLGDRTSPTIYESLDAGKSWKALVSLDKEKYYRVWSVVLHKGQLYFSVMRRITGILALFADPLSGATFRVDNGTPTELSGSLKRVVVGFHSTKDALYAVSHINGLFKLGATGWSEISQQLPNMGFNQVLVVGNALLVAGGCDFDLTLTRRIGDDTIVNEIYRSTDNGASWTGLLKSNPFKSGIKRVLPHPDNANVLYAATGTGVYLSVDNGATWTAENSGLSFVNIGAMVVGKGTIYVGTLGGGVYAGTIGSDYRITWSASNGPFPRITNVQLRVDPKDSQTLYATAYPGGVFKSSDGGKTWGERNFGMPSFKVTDPMIQGYYNLAIDPQNPKTLYLGIFKRGVYKSTDGAGTWKPMYGSLGQNVAIMQLGITQVKVHPTNSQLVYLASDKGVYLSTDGAENWQAINQGLDSLDVLSLSVLANGSVFAGTNGNGVYTWNASSKSWTHMGSPHGIGSWKVWERRIYQFSSLLYDPKTPGRVYLGHFPGGFFVSQDDGKSWTSSSLGLGNDGMFSLTMHPTQSDVLFAGTYNGVVKSADGGKTWSMKSKGMPPEQWPFAVVIDPKTPDTMYVVTKNGKNKGFCHLNDFCGVVMKSTDGGENWTKIMTGLKETAEYYALVIHPKNAKTLFLSSSDRIFASNDAGASWIPINTGLPARFEGVRDNVAQNLKLSADGKHLILGLIGRGVFRADISGLTF